MTLTQLESERACPISRGSKRTTKRVFEKQKNVSPFHLDYLLSAEVDVPSECERELLA
jgi:hypothetical protein